MEIATLREFWDLVVTVWRHGVYGVDIVHILVALLILMLSLGVRNLFSRYALGAMHRWASRSDSQVDDILLDALRNPLRFIPVVVGFFFAASVLKVEGEVEAFLYNINRSLVVFTIFWALFQLCSPVGMVLQRSRRLLTEAMVQWIVKLLKLIFVLLGAAAILELWGIAVGPIIAGLGLFGVAVALGAQDLFKNLIAGLLSSASAALRSVTGFWWKGSWRARSCRSVSAPPPCAVSTRRRYTCPTRGWRTTRSPTSRA